MKDTIFIAGLCLVIVAIGAALYFFEPDHTAKSMEGEVGFEVLREGEYAVGVERETNYRIETQEEFEALWGLIHGSERPSLPAVDFERYEVLAVFDGTHTSGGYEINVERVVDEGLTRTVHITHVRPGEGCMTTSAITSPYELVTLPKMRDSLRLAHVDLVERSECR